MERSCKKRWEEGRAEAAEPPKKASQASGKEEQKEASREALRGVGGPGTRSGGKNQATKTEPGQLGSSAARPHDSSIQTRKNLAKGEDRSKSAHPQNPPAGAANPRSKCRSPRLRINTFRECKTSTPPGVE